MPHIFIRKATPADLEILLQFEQNIIETERPFDDRIKDQASYYDLNKLIHSDSSEVLVATSDDIIIGSGYAKVQKADPFFKHEYHAYLGFMYVSPDFRGQGVNKLIIDDLLNWSKSKGLTEIRLEVYDANAPAVRAYEKAGFTKKLVEMCMVLPAD